MLVKIKYTGPGSRVIAGKHVMHGETSEVNEKLVAGLRGDPDIEFLDEVPAVQEIDPIDRRVVEAELKLEPWAGSPKEPIALQPVKPAKKAKVVPDPAGKPVRKPRGKRK